MGTKVSVQQGGTFLTTVPLGSVVVAQAANVLSALTSTTGTKILTNTSGVLSWEVVGSGITSLNSLTGAAQTFSVGTTGDDFGISSATTVHTFNLPTASSTKRGALSSADWSTFNGKQAGDASLTSIAGLTYASGSYIALTAADTYSVRTYAQVLGDIGAAATGQTFYIGTTQVAINRGSAALTLAGITLTTPDIGTPSAGVLTSCTGLPYSGLADGIDGNLITWNSSGVIALVSTGDAGQVLTSNGVGTAPTFQVGGGGTPTVITVANEATDTSCFPLFVTAATGDLGPKTVASLTLNSNTGALGVGSLSSAGAINGTIITASVQLITSVDSDTPATCALIDLRKARDGDPTDNVADNDYLGEIRFRGYHTDGYYEGAIIRAVVNGTPGSGDMPTELIFATSADSSATPTTRLTIDATGLATFTGTVALGANNLTMTGSLGATGAGKLTKGWFTNLECTNDITINGSAMATIYAAIAQTMYIGTTGVAINRGTGALTLAGITLTTPNIGEATGTSLQLSGLTASEILGTDASKNIVSLAVATYPSLTELSYVKGLSSAIQTQVGAKAPSANPTFTGTVILPKAIEIQDTSADHQYVLAVSELTADRTITLPLLTGNDEFVFKDFIQTLTNKTLTKPVINGTNPTGATYTPATGAQTVTIDCAANNMHIVTGHADGTAITFAVSNVTNNQPFIISILQGAVVSTIAAWFATIRWAGGSAPTLTATVGKRDTFGFIRTGADTYDGFVIGQNA